MAVLGGGLERKGGWHLFKNIILHSWFGQNYSSQWAHHGQTTSKQRCSNAINVDITLFRRHFTMMCLLGLVDMTYLQKLSLNSCVEELTVSNQSLSSSTLSCDLLTVSNQSLSSSTLRCVLLRLTNHLPPILFCSSSHIGSIPS